MCVCVCSSLNIFLYTFTYIRARHRQTTNDKIHKEAIICNATTTLLPIHLFKSDTRLFSVNWSVSKKFHRYRKKYSSWKREREKSINLASQKFFFFSTIFRESSKKNISRLFEGFFFYRLREKEGEKFFFTLCEFSLLLCAFD